MAESRITLKQLESRLAKLTDHAVSFAATAYRSTTPKYANSRDLVNGVGSQRAGGRWDPVGIAAVYASLTPETALAESLAHFRFYGFPIEDAMPRTFVALDVQMQSILDLRDLAIRRQLGASIKRSFRSDWRSDVLAGKIPVTQLIGRAAEKVGLEGLLVPSAVDDGGTNIVIFPRTLRAERVLRVQNSDRLHE
jgi:RES domain-containing protein